MFAIIVTSIHAGASSDRLAIREMKYFGTPGPTTLDKGSLSLTRSLDVPRISRYDVDTETPRPEKLVLDFDTTVNSSPTDISGHGNHGVFLNAQYSAADKAFSFDGTGDTVYVDRNGNLADTNLPTGDAIYTMSCWIKANTAQYGYPAAVFYFGSAWTTSQLAGIYHAANGKINLDIGGNNMGTATGTIQSNRWYHVAVVKRGTGTIAAAHSYGSIYIDGQEIPHGNLTIAGSGTQGLQSIDNISIGSNFNGSPGSFTEAFNGLISKPQIWNVALENSEVKKLYNLGRTGRSMVISDTAVGIGKVPEAQLDVRGNIKCDGVVRPYTCAFAAYASSGGDSSTTGIFPADSVHFNIGNCYDTSTYKFIASVHGIYNMSWSAFTNTGATTTSRIFAYLNNGAVAQKGHTIEKHGNSLSLTVELEAGDTFHFGGTGSFPIYYYGAGGHNRFCGHLICAL
jgi:hypothetical protein